MNRKFFTIFALLVVSSLLLAACAPAPSDTTADTDAPPAEEATVAPTLAPAPAGHGVTLSAVVDRGTLICGVNSQVPGFGYVDANGDFSGFDVDFCRAMAAAIFGDPDLVQYRPVTTTDRFTALQSGEIDVLSRNTTWSLVRDTELAGNFVHTTFYDGQGMMVPTALGATTLQDLEGATVCVQTGTTTELNLADVMASEGVSYTPAVFEDADATFAAYQEGRCDAVTTDKSGLIARKTILADPAAHMIMDVTMSKEPLGPMVRHGDDQWFDITQWTVFVLIAGEEFGITSANVDDMRASATAPEVRRLLGLEGDLGLKLGLSNDWAYNVLAQVGNYAEVYNRNLGPDTPTYIPRGLNSSYLDGGVLYAPPFR